MLLTKSTDPKSDIDRLIPCSPVELKPVILLMLVNEWWLHQMCPEFEAIWENGHPALAINVSVGQEHMHEYSTWPGRVSGLEEMMREQGYNVEVISDRIDHGYVSYLIIISARHL